MFSLRAMSFLAVVEVRMRMIEILEILYGSNERQERMRKIVE